MRGITEGVLFDTFKYGMLTANGAVHRQRRSPFTKTFAARLIMEMRPQLRMAADDLIDSWHAEGEVDLVDRYAALIPARAISQLLSLPRRTSRTSRSLFTASPVSSASRLRPTICRRWKKPRAS
ncbi:MAG: hypothetical protein WDN49_14000 [Acetobacteraceae bacterium]